LLFDSPDLRVIFNAISLSPDLLRRLTMKALLLVAAAALVYSIAELANLQLLTMLWIPLTMLLFLIGFPLFAVVGQSSLFWGLFDLPLSPTKKLPIRLFVATLSAFAVAGSAMSIIALDWNSGPERMGLGEVAAPALLSNAGHAVVDALGGPFVFALLVANAITAFFVYFGITTSWDQDKTNRPLGKLVAGALAGLATGTVLVLAIDKFIAPAVQDFAGKTASSPFVQWLGPGYEGTHWAGHLGAALAFFGALGLYVILGFYGKRMLGTKPTVAAVVAPLMVVLLLGWTGSSLQFLLSRWHIPLLLVVAALGLINNRFPWTDHTYELLPRDHTPAAPPYEVLTVGGRKCAILVASAGGGIQAAAWTAQVLEGLHNEFGTKFDRALCLISSISGGSMGSACYVDWLNRGAPEESGDLHTPSHAAAASSLDEVAWGLAWPDLLRVLLPIPIKMDRAHAMERAWIGNAGTATLNAPLSSWNKPTAEGKLPALIMNSTMVEAGGPLLLGTSDVNGARDKQRTSNSWWDGDKLHVNNGSKLDIPVVRCARLSATFPYVTPAARPANAEHQPHMMDGGFYDNYGMATLTEWIDQALEEQAGKDIPASERINRVLVLQINGFPPSTFMPPKPPVGRGGWLLQLIDPIRILVSVRTAGQSSHRDVEIKLLEDKWRAHGVQIDHVNFELEKSDAPLSWHLMPKQKADIVDAWDSEASVREARETVRKFLDERPSEYPTVRKGSAPTPPPMEAGASA
jgi:hypothetical protein